MDLIPFKFNDIALKESCWINDEPYFTRRAIGEWLEYENLKQAIRKIIERNPHIENPAWSVVVKLTTTDGKNYDTQVYNPIGLQLIVFESNQPKAIKYKVAVAHLVSEFLKGNLHIERRPTKAEQKRAELLSLPAKLGLEKPGAGV